MRPPKGGAGDDGPDMPGISGIPGIVPVWRTGAGASLLWERAARAGDAAIARVRVRISVIPMWMSVLAEAV
jgi:hypothetical protein